MREIYGSFAAKCSTSEHSLLFGVEEIVFSGVLGFFLHKTQVPIVSESVADESESKQGLVPLSAALKSNFPPG